MNSPTFRNMWRDENFESRAHVVVTALDNDLDGMRAYFCGRAWFPVRIPLFFMGMLLAIYAPALRPSTGSINKPSESGRNSLIISLSPLHHGSSRASSPPASSKIPRTFASSRISSPRRARFASRTVSPSQAIIHGASAQESSHANHRYMVIRYVPPPISTLPRGPRSSSTPCASFRRATAILPRSRCGPIVSTL